MNAPALERSRAQVLVAQLVDEYGKEGARRVITAITSKLSTTERAALAARWSFWARPKQLAPTGNWRTWGFLAGRGFGKTYAGSKFVNDEVEAGRARWVGLAAQDEENTIALQVLGPSGLIATAPPWFKPEWEATSKQLIWPNGARGVVRTPERPGKIRGFEYHLSWIIELQSWPVAKRIEAMSNFRISTRLGYGRIVWDATAKKGNPLLLEMLEDEKREPTRNIVVRGTTHENAANLGEGYVEDLDKKYGGTAKGREEIGGEMLTDSEKAVAQQAWIDNARRPRPETIVRRGLGIDPAVSKRKSSDRTGIIDAGLGADGQALILGDLSGKYAPHEWAKIALDRYVEGRCDVAVVERNKGGDLVVEALRAAALRSAADKGDLDSELEIILVGEDERTHWQPGVVFVKEVHSRGAKADRAQPLSIAYKRGRVSHVDGVDLTSLEETLTTWEPTEGGLSPDDLDAEVSIVSELLELTQDKPDPTVGFPGLKEMSTALNAPGGSGTAELAGALEQLLGRRGGDKI